MRIIVFTPYYPPHIGGLESHAAQFNQYISQQGIDIVVFAPRIPRTAPSREKEHDRVVVVRFPAFEIMPNYPVPKFWKISFWKDWFDLRRGGGDLILSRTRFFFTSLMAWRFSAKNKLPWIHIEHGSDFAVFNGKFKTQLGKTYDRVVGRFILRSSNKNVANSRASAAFVKKLSGRTDCKVVYRGVEAISISEIEANTDIRSRYGNTPLIIYLGRLIDGKGIGDLIMALDFLKKKDYHCLIVGNGPDRKRLEALARSRQLSKRISFLGHQSLNHSMGILKSSDIFVNPSHTEGIPTAVIEAAICKKAIVATNVGGTCEIITGMRDGLLVPPKNPQAIASALSVFLDHPEQRILHGKAAFERVRNKFDWKVSTDHYLEIFKEATQTSRK